jgi:hypothetical protein
MIGCDKTFFNARMHDGVIQQMMKEVVKRTMSGDL